jgi:hypothetical protein
MPAKLVCADCHFVIDAAEKDRPKNCPQCHAPIHSFAPEVAPAKADDPPKRAKPATARRAPKDDEDDAPRPRRSRRRDDDDDDRPSRRAAPSGSPVLLLLGIGGFLIAALGGLGYAAWSRMRDPGPAPVPVVVAPPAPPIQPVPAAPLPEANAPRPALPDAGMAKPMEQEKQGPVAGLPVPRNPRNPRVAIEPPKAPPAPPKPEALPLKLPPVDPLPLAAAHDVTDRREMSLPGEVTAACVGGGGRFVCLHFEKLRQIGLFDTTVAKMVKYLPVTNEGVAMAANMDRLIVHDKTADVFVRWNLRTFEKEVTLPNPTGVTVGRLLMGSATSGPLVVVPKQDPNAYLQGEAKFLDPISLKAFAVEKSANAGGVNALNGYLSENGKLLVGHGGWHNEYYFGQVGPTFDVKKVQINVVGQPRPSADGRFVYTNNGIYTASGAAVGSPTATNSAAVEPAVQGGLVVRAFARETPGYGGPRDRGGDADADLKFYLDGQSAPFLTWSKVAVPLPGGYQPPGGALDRRFFLVPDAKLFAALSATNTKLILRRFDVLEELEKSGVDYLLVASRPTPAVLGKQYTYPIVVKSKKGGVKFKLESGPDGMKVADDGKLTWFVPLDASPASVLITVSDATGQEVFHNFTLDPVSADAVATAPAPAVAPASADPPKASVSPVAEAGAAVVEVPTKVFPLTPTKAADGAEVKLPGAADAACTAGGGRFVVLRIPSVKQLAILDVCEGKVAKYLPVAEDKPLIAGGMNKLFVLNTTANVIQRYDLRTFEKELTVANPVDGGTPKQIVMGHAVDGPLLVTHADPTRGWGGKHAFLSPKTLKPIEVKAGTNMGHGGGGLNGLTEGLVRASADGRVYGHWRLNSSPTGLSCVVLADDGTAAGHYEHTSVGPILPGPDGTLHTNNGLYTAQLKPVGTGHAQYATGPARVPAAHGTFYLEFETTATAPRPGTTIPKKKGAADPTPGVVGPTVRMIGEATPLVKLDKMAGYTTPADRGEQMFYRGDGIAFYDRFHLVPAANVLVVLDAAKTSVFFNKLNIKEKLAAGGSDYLMVVSKPGGAVRGQTFAYKPEVWSKGAGVKFKVETGPEGMTATATGVEWPVPKDVGLGTVDVILTVTNAAGKEVFHTFKLAVTDGK